MAVETLSSGGLNGALATTFSARLRRQWNRSAVTSRLIQMVPASGQGGGKQVGWDVAFSGAAAASFAEGSAIGGSEAASDLDRAAVLPFGWYRSTFQISNLAVKAAKASAANAAELGRIVVERLDGSLSKMASVANADIHSGTGTDGSSNPNIIGLTTALAATGTYAGLAKGTFAEWAGNTLANGGTARPLTMDLLYNLEQLIFVASGKAPKVIVCSPGVYRKYAGLFEAIKRITVGPDGTAPKYEGGARELSWNGMPVIRDKDCETGTLKMLNTDDIKLRPLVDAVDDDGLGGPSRVLPSSNGEDSEATPLVCDVYPLGRVGSSIQFVAEMYLQLQVERVNSSGIISDISET